MDRTARLIGCGATLVVMHALLLAAGCQGSEAPVGVQARPSSGPSASPAGDLGGNVGLSGAFVFFEDFENGTGRWRLPAPGPVSWRLLKTTSCGGAYAMLFGADRQAPFANVAADEYFTLDGAIDLGAAKNPKLALDVRGSSEPADALAIQPEVRVASGAWQPLGPAIAGNHPAMNTLHVDLAAWRGQTIGLRFHGSQRAVPAAGTGMLLDNVQIIDLGAL